MRLTPAQQQQNLDYLATLSTEQLEGSTVTYLRKVLSSVGISNVDRNGTTIQAGHARKSELIAAILEVTVSLRTLAKLELTEVNPTDINATLEGLALNTDASVAGYAHKVYQELREYTLSQWDAQTGTWKLPTQYPQTLSLGLYVWLDGYRTGSGERLEDNTRVVYASRIRNQVKRLINECDRNSQYYDQLMGHYQDFARHNHEQYKVLTGAKREFQSGRAVIRRGHSQPTNPYLMIERARDTLTKASCNSGRYRIALPIYQTARVAAFLLFV